MYRSFFVFFLIIYICTLNFQLTWCFSWTSIISCFTGICACWLSCGFSDDIFGYTILISHALVLECCSILKPKKIWYGNERNGNSDLNSSFITSLNNVCTLTATENLFCLHAMLWYTFLMNWKLFWGCDLWLLLYSGEWWSWRRRRRNIGGGGGDKCINAHQLWKPVVTYCNMDL